MTPQAYANRVLDLIEHRALYADRVHWPAVRARLLAAADRAVAPAELHEALDVVVQEAGGRHSRLLPPNTVRQLAGRPSRLPEARVVDGAGVVVLPACRGDRRGRRVYAAAGGRALGLLPPVRGWVVISEHQVRFAEDSGDYAWLSAYRPVQMIGKSMRLYYVP